MKAAGWDCASAARRRVRNSLGGLALVVGCVHAALLAAPSPPTSPRVEGVKRPAVQLRSISMEMPMSAAAAAPYETTPGRLAPRQRPEARLVAASVSTTSPAAAAVPDWRTSPADAFADYLPRSALSVGPRPQLPVLIDYPSFASESEHYAGEFEIFIDDSGGVVRVVAEDPSLPLILVQAVRDAFLPARFAPGEVDGFAVRSRIRIEVVFESRPPPG